MSMKTVLSISLLGLVILMVTGCGVKSVVPAQNKFTKEGIAVEAITVVSPAGSGLSRATGATSSAWGALQFASERTLATGFNYFAIHRPKLISNTDGSTMNTAEEFSVKCTNSGAGSVASAFDAFGFNTYACNMTPGGKATAFIEFIVYTEKPNNVMVYDPKEVLGFMKANNLYIDPTEFKVRNKNFAKREYAKWYRNYRDKL